ncbi:MAG: hypothetical protein IH945_04850 [Armatimonadetes bacterium]|nr:hypothetical protein [Armatimonadota bacterium]
MGLVALFLVSAVVVPYASAARLRSEILRQIGTAIDPGNTREEANALLEEAGYGIVYIDGRSGRRDMTIGYYHMTEHYAVWIPFTGAYRVKIQIYFDGEVIESSEVVVWHEIL